MAVFSDGTTDVTINYVDEKVIPSLEKSTGTSAYGKLKSQTAGERLQFNLKLRASAADFRSLINLLNNGADEYYYTPNDTHQFYTTSDTVTFPINVVFDKIGTSWDNRSYYYINMTATSVDFV